ncbi:MAG TPA: alpha/beta hydrolase family protein [Candidatus Acidoferrales bacterium]|jgi:S-formylglutathione hydrolase FrmB|nr:alpha/beta hydrolase family protein [Candidatus Acidoferrales bacterium]
MPSSRKSRLLLPSAFLLVFSALVVSGARADESVDCRVFRSAILHSAVRYCVFLPASYSLPEGKLRKYPVLYLLHGLGGTQQSAVLNGEWTVLQDLRRDHKIGDFIVVSPEAWDTFYINSRDGGTRYSDFFISEFLPHIEGTYRIQSTRLTRGITGFSMGGYGALRFAFLRPDLFGSVSAHSAAIERDPPDAVSGMQSPGNFVSGVLGKTFGDPIDKPFWFRNSPYELAKKNATSLKSQRIYFDCGTEDTFGLYVGASEMHKALDSLKIPHEFHLYPGGHGGSYLLQHRDASFEFHWHVFHPDSEKGK